MTEEQAEAIYEVLEGFDFSDESKDRVVDRVRRLISAACRDGSEARIENKKFREALANVISPASCMLRGDEGASVELSLAINKARKLIQP